MYLTIITPLSKIFSGEVDMVEFPASQGTMRVLPEHTPFVTILNKGQTIYKQKDANDNTAIDLDGGVVEISSDCVTILTVDPESSS